MTGSQNDDLGGKKLGKKNAEVSGQKSDEASQLWAKYTGQKDAKNKSSNRWLGIILGLGLFVLFVGLYIIAFK
jgi:hypothetical protein